MKLKSVIHKFSTARTEFHSVSNSVIERFVVPPFIDVIDLARIDHSMAIVGGRGCGKTTYVRYFSHWTQFDKSKADVSQSSLDCIVFYWKPDTTYCRSMAQSWLSEHNARMFFLALSGLSLLKELISALENISFHFPDIGVAISNNTEFWERFSKIACIEIDDLSKSKTWLDDALYDVQVSINSNDTSSLVRIDPKAMFSLLLPTLSNNVDRLSKTRFKVFIDEFENLAEYQQRIINGYRKHSDAFLSWNVAHKRFARLSNATDGDEKLQHGNDYRDYILDESFESENEEKFFLCELLLLGLLTTNLSCDIKDLNLQTLGDRSKLQVRKDKAYRENVLKMVERILPTESNRDLAKIAMDMSSVKTLTTQSLSKIPGLSEEAISFLIKEAPDVAIATIAISSQQSFKAEDLISYIESEFSTKHKYNQRVQTYLLTSLLNLNARYSYITIPIYSGFDRFCQLTLLNIRHFFELCYNSFLSLDAEVEISSIDEFPSISLENMHRGAINASSNIIKEIPTYTPMGLTLNGLVNRLGDIFQIWQRGDWQSEPEKTHFFIKHDFGSLPKELNDVIEQAKCWRVLIEYPATKDKNSDSSSGYEYRLNPIYAPYFDISFRKIRRLEITELTFRDLCYGDSKAYEKIRIEHLQRAKIPDKLEKEQGSLFE